MASCLAQSQVRQIKIRQRQRFGRYHLIIPQLAIRACDVRRCDVDNVWLSAYQNTVRDVIRLHWRGNERFTGLEIQIQVEALTVLSQGIRHQTERRRMPRIRALLGNGLNPLPKSTQRLFGNATQRFVRRLLFGQPRIEQLLHGPGSLAKLGQPDHARAALERVERAPQRGDLLNVRRRCLQGSDDAMAVLDHLTRFLQEDVQQIVVFCGARIRPHCLRGRWRSWRRSARHGRQRLKRAGKLVRVLTPRDIRSVRRRLGKCWLFIQGRLGSQLLKLSRQGLRRNLIKSIEVRHWL